MKNFKEKIRIANKICQKKKREWQNQRLSKVQNNFNEKQSRKYFKILKDIKGGFQPRISVSKDKKGKHITEGGKVIERWVEFFSDILNKEVTDVE